MEAVVVDANLLVALVTRDPRRPRVAAQFRDWDETEQELHAPALIRYEITNALTGLLAAKQINDEDVDEAWRAVSSVPITLHALGDGPAVVRLAIRLGRRSAYDAAYIALATELAADRWTLDGPLARNAGGIGLPVRLLAAS
jgi:predicted nucleic acid-binding protein